MNCNRCGATMVPIQSQSMCPECGQSAPETH